MQLTGKNQSTRGKTCPSATLSTTNPTWTEPESNPGLRSGRPAANRLSHGTAISNHLRFYIEVGVGVGKGVGTFYRLRLFTDSDSTALLVAQASS
jgi:hypothetical protein